MGRNGFTHKMVLAASAVLLLFAVAHAQVTTADIVGRVVDASGSVVPSAKVTLVNLGTNNNRTAETNDTGEFIFNLLPPGRYSVRIEKSGFKTFDVADITVASGDRSRVDAQMAVGQTSETVEVSAQAALLQ